MRLLEVQSSCTACDSSRVVRRGRLNTKISVTTPPNPPEFGGFVSPSGFFPVVISLGNNQERRGHCTQIDVWSHFEPISCRWRHMCKYRRELLPLDQARHWSRGNNSLLYVFTKTQLEHSLMAGGLEFKTFSRLYQREVYSLSRFEPSQEWVVIMMCFRQICSRAIPNICDNIYIVRKYCTIS